MLPRAFLSLLHFLLATPEGRLTATSRVVAATSLLEDTKRKSIFPLQRLENSPDYQALEQRDRSFARALVATTERRRGQIDKIIEYCRNEKPAATKGGKQKKKRKDDLLVDATLRLGIAQMLFLDVPVHAAVKETVDVLRTTPGTKVTESKIKFTNAVLRRVSREGTTLMDDQTDPSDNISPWLLKRWGKDWGPEAVAQMSEAFMKQSPIHLSVKYPSDDRSDATRETRRQEIMEAIGGETIILPNGSIRIGDDIGGLVNRWPLYDEGLWWVQDVSASLPALALASAVQEGEMDDMHVVDMCAAPGGKTAQLASLGFGSVSAVESSQKRSRRLKKNLERLDMLDVCSICVADGTEWTAPDGDKKVDGILLDVPCSATGTGSKRPDVLRRSEDLAELLETQAKLANHCADNILQPGGIMVYATCSVLKEESEHQVTNLLSRKDGAEMETLPFEAGEIPGFDTCIDENGWMRVLPGALNESIGQCDGFFVARLKRVS